MANTELKMRLDELARMIETDIKQLLNECDDCCQNDECCNESCPMASCSACGELCIALELNCSDCAVNTSSMKCKLLEAMETIHALKKEIRGGV